MTFHVEHHGAPSKRYFVTGTDTGVGKTFVTAALARRARARGQKVFAFKPIETGCVAVVGGDAGASLVGADIEALCESAGGWQRGSLRGLYRLRQAAAPLVAARAENIEIDLELVARTVDEGSRGVDVALVEGAGGWRVPITASADMSTLALRLAVPVIVVARAGLGTINHSLLTLEAVERDGAPIAALVLSHRPDDDPEFTRSNASQIAGRWSGRIVNYDGDGAALDTLL